MMKILDPWTSTGIDDYNHVFKEFGVKELKKQEFPLKHRFFERGIVYAHRDFDKVYARIKKKQPFINMTGIATTGPLHLGHKVDIDLFMYFKSLGAKNYFGFTDIDAYTSRPDSKVSSIEKAKQIAVDNIMDGLALGLEEKDIFVQSQKEKRYYEFTFELSKKITENMFRAIYGHLDLGKISAVILQIADILHPQLKEYEGPMPSITGIGLEQDAHMRITRDVAARLPYKIEKPSSIYFKYQSGLKQGKKMSSSEPETAIFLSDNKKQITKKINKCFTGGKVSVEEQKKEGGNPEICKNFEILKYHYPNTKKLEEMHSKCLNGELLCGECKQFCISFLTKFLEEHQRKREKCKNLAHEIVYGKSKN